VRADAGSRSSWRRVSPALDPCTGFRDNAVWRLPTGSAGLPDRRAGRWRDGYRAVDAVIGKAYPRRRVRDPEYGHPIHRVISWRPDTKGLCRQDKSATLQNTFPDGPPPPGVRGRFPHSRQTPRRKQCRGEPAPNRSQRSIPEGPTSPRRPRFR